MKKSTKIWLIAAAALLAVGLALCVCRAGVGGL